MSSISTEVWMNRLAFRSSIAFVAAEKQFTLERRDTAFTIQIREPIAYSSGKCYQSSKPTQVERIIGSW